MYLFSILIYLSYALVELTFLTEYVSILFIRRDFWLLRTKTQKRLSRACGCHA